MPFLHPWLLAGSALVAIPIVLHLIMRQKPRRLEFPALRFIQRRHDANQRRLLLRHLLLLLLRTALIALLAVALARPRVELPESLGRLIPGSFARLLGLEVAGQEAPVAAALVFDTAPRMEYRHDNQTRLEAAKKLGQWVLGQLPAESQIAVLDTRRGVGAFQVERGAARDRIRRLESAANSQPLTAVVEQALRLLGESDLAGKEVYVFTDLSRGAWPAQGAASLHELSTDVPGAQIYVIDVGLSEPVNYALGEVRLSGQVLSHRSTLGIETTLTRIGGPAEAAEDRTVELHLLDKNHQPQKRGEQTCTLRPGQSQQVEFSVGPLGLGTQQGFVRIVGQDALGCDDLRYFTVAVKPAWRVLLAAPRPADRYALFLREALAPTDYRKRGAARFDCDVVELADLTQRNLDGYAAVCLLDPTPLEPAVWQQLGDFASGGRGVAVFLGRNARPVDSFNHPAAQEMLAGKLLRQARRPEGDCFLAPRDDQHPLLAAFRDFSGAIPWDAFPVLRYWELEKPHAGVGVVVRLSDHGPLLLERPLGSGRVLTMTTPVSDRPAEGPWNLLPAGEAWPFVILANQMLAYLVGSSDQQLNYSAGQTAVLRLDRPPQRPNFLLTTPAEVSFPVSADPQRRQLLITATDQAGNYRVQAGGESGVDLGFSVNLSLEQTDLERVSESDLAEVFGPFRFRIAQSREQIDRVANTPRVGVELFAALILAVGAVLLAEHVVASLFYKE